MSRRRFPTGGARSPRGASWQIGKTVATIRFVMEAERRLKDGGLSLKEADLLQARVDELKACAPEENLMSDVAVDDFLASLKKE